MTDITQLLFRSGSEANLQNSKQTAFDPNIVLMHTKGSALNSTNNLAKPLVIPVPSLPVTERQSEVLSAPALPILVVSTLLAERRLRDGSIIPKTQRQMMSIFGLLARFMRETYNVDDAHHVKQAHFAKLSDFFDELPKSYGKSPSDKLKSIVQLQEKGQEVSHEKRGLDPGTRNRHLTYLGQWLNEATARGASNCRDIKLTSFRSRRKGRPRDDRPAPGLKRSLGFSKARLLWGAWIVIALASQALKFSIAPHTLPR